MTAEYHIGDIHRLIKDIPTNSIDFIYTDPPFGITKAEWDTPLDWLTLFPEMWRVLKPMGVICLYASMPFTYELLRYHKPKYHYTWLKDNTTGFLTARKQPLRCMEEVFIYYERNGTTYNPQMIGDTEYQRRNLCHSGGSGYFASSEGAKYKAKKGHHKGRFPTTLIQSGIRNDKTGISRTDDHIDFFIKTYTNEEDTVLDMTCHNKTVGNRCLALNRNYIGCDLTL
jgi:site-specific DNA-methyltransferase (adenine-specific)